MCVHDVCMVCVCVCVCECVCVCHNVHTCCWEEVGLIRFWHAMEMAWDALANCVWSTNPGVAAVLDGSAIPTRYAAWALA